MKNSSDHNSTSNNNRQPVIAIWQVPHKTKARKQTADQEDQKTLPEGSAEQIIGLLLLFDLIKSIDRSGVEEALGAFA